MIYKDQKGNEFNVSPETFINPTTGKQVTTNSNIKPMLNPEGKQVRNPVVLEYEYIGEQDVTDIGEANPYLYFGSQFAKETIKPLPTTFSNTLNVAETAMRLGTNSIDIFARGYNFPTDPKIKETIHDTSITDFAHILVEEFASNFKTNMLTIYNNNLRMILDLYFTGREEDKGILDMNPMEYQIKDIALAHLLDSKGNPILGLNSLPLLANSVSFLANMVSSTYSRIINNAMAANVIDFYNLAKSRIDKDGIQVPVEYYYSFGVDIAREIANMEVGRNIDLAEINLAHMITKFNLYLRDNTNLLTEE